MVYEKLNPSKDSEPHEWVSGAGQNEIGAAQKQVDMGMDSLKVRFQVRNQKTYIEHPEFARSETVEK